MHMKMARRAFQNSKNQEIWSKNEQDMALRKKGQTGGAGQVNQQMGHFVTDFRYANELETRISLLIQIQKPQINIKQQDFFYPQTKLKPTQDLVFCSIFYLT